MKLLELLFSALVARDFEQQFVIDFLETIKCNFNKNVSHLYELLLHKNTRKPKAHQLQSWLLSQLSVGEEVNA